MNIPLFSMILNIKNFNEDKIKNLLNIFNFEIGNKDFSVKLDSHEKYYKYPDEEKCLIYIYSNEYISLKTILKKYKNILWQYNSSGECFFEKNEYLCIFKDEDAFWNSDFQNEYFLHPDITWVNFITFPIDPNIVEQNEPD